MLPNNRNFDLFAAPCLPTVLAQMLDASVREDETFAHAAQLALLDPALYAQLVEAASALGLTTNRRFAVVSKLLAGLGWNTIRTLVSNASLLQSERRTGGFDLARLWHKAIHGAHFCQQIALKIHYPNPQEAYTAGLLADLGQLLMLGRSPQAYALLLGQNKTSSELIDAERSQFDATHVELAEHLIGGWNFDSFIADAVRYQHHSQSTTLLAHPLIRIVNLCAHFRLSSKLSEDQIERARAFFGLDEQELMRLVVNVDEATEQVAADLHLDSTLVLDTPSLENTFGDVTPLTQSLRAVHLLNAVQYELASTHDQRQVLTTVRGPLRALFGVHDAVPFIVEPGTKLLRGMVGHGQSARIAELSVPLDDVRSLLTDCLNTNLPRNSFDDRVEPCVVDEQIVRLLGAEGMLCLPLKHGEVALGVLVLFIDRTGFARLETQQAVLMAFARRVAQIIFRFSRAEMPALAAGSGTVSVLTVTQLRRIVHEVNNPLGIMKNYIKILSAKLDKEDPAHFGFGVIEEEIERVTKILRGLADSTENKSAVPTPCHVNQLIFDLLRITDEALWVHDSIRLRTDLDHTVKPIPCDKDKLKQVLINLIKNAAEAMPGGGEITISTRANGKHAGADCVEIEVADTGPGLPSEVMVRLFEPVPTSKGNEHFGLGLSIVNNLINELGGAIRCSSDDKHGTRFLILLPAGF
jgi:signal transduction histidine kinase/HD-like signal output (HDOD) protein